MHKDTHLVMQKLRNMLRKVPVRIHKKAQNLILLALLIHGLLQTLKSVKCLPHKAIRPLMQKFQHVLHRAIKNLKLPQVMMLLVI